MPADVLPRFDDLYVVSDIHMGGESGFQILKHGPRLGAFIEHVAATSGGREVALVLNGDVIDSLAEDINGYVAMDEALRMMDRIYEDPSFKPIWDGLAKFLETASCHLVIVAGNHDIELALPTVERSVRRRIAGESPERNGRLHFATNGGGFACLVGDARVFCTHGNEVDDWNVVNHEQLSQLGNALNAGRVPDRSEWKPNAGTRMVVKVMNPIKRQFPFVDLLKPETKAVPGVLAVLDPGRVRKLKLGDIASILTGKVKGSLVTSNLLSADAEDIDEAGDVAAAAGVAMNELLGANLLEAVGSGGAPRPSASAEELLLAVEDDLEADRSALEVAEIEGEEGTLGVWGYVVDRIRGVSKEEGLRRALLDWLEDDDSFAIGKRDSTFEDITDRVGPDVDFVVTGHTHLMRAIRIDRDVDRFYYNCGTWIRLIRFTQAVLNSEDEFLNVYEVLKSGSMQALDKARVPGPDGVGPLVIDSSSAVHISAKDDAVVGELLLVSGVDDGTPVSLAKVPGSEFSRKGGGA